MRPSRLLRSMAHVSPMYSEIVDQVRQQEDLQGVLDYRRLADFNRCSIMRTDW